MLPHRPEGVDSVLGVVPPLVLVVWHALGEDVPLLGKVVRHQEVGGALDLGTLSLLANVKSKTQEVVLKKKEFVVFFVSN